MPNKELYVNGSSGFLAASINSSVTAMTVTGGIWPNGQFTIICDGELLLVTAVTGTVPFSFTIVRAQEGTAAQNHNVNALVFANLTDGALRKLGRQSLNGTNVSARREINFVGTGVALTDDPTNDKVDVTIGVGIGTTLPGSPFTGQTYYLTTDDTMNVWNGSAWKKSPTYT